VPAFVAAGGGKASQTRSYQPCTLGCLREAWNGKGDSGDADSDEEADGVVGSAASSVAAGRRNRAKQSDAQHVDRKGDGGSRAADTVLPHRSTGSSVESGKEEL